MKKIISLSLVIIMSLAVFIACKAENNNESSADANNSDNNSKSESNDISEDIYCINGDYVVGLEKKDFEQREFRILVRGSDSTTYQSSEFTADSELLGDTFNVAVVERNRKVEEKYNVKIVLTKKEGIGTLVTNLFQSGDDEYDVIMPPIYTLVNQAQQGNLYDLNTIEEIDLNAPWWDQNANSSLSIANKLFFTLGDITILNKICTTSMIFNKDLIDEFNMESPYDLVNDHKWTFDKMHEMAVEATFDLDGINGMSTEDQWGILTSHGDMISFYVSANQNLCKKDSNDYPYVTLTDETSVNIAQYILGKLTDKGTWAIFAQDFSGTDIWVSSFVAFCENRVLFRPSAFSAMAKLRAFEVNFGIVPMPLWNEEQDDYASYCITGEVVAAAIPITCNDTYFAGYMLEVLACEAKNYITPAYMEVNLKSKDTRDDESLEMLKIIFNNIVYDVGDVYNFGSSNASGIKTFLLNLVKEGKTEIISSYEAIKNVVESDIDKAITNFKNF